KQLDPSAQHHHGLMSSDGLLMKQKHNLTHLPDPRRHSGPKK
ncbi:hypothetical protein A2U01_0103685, partial [Trifolium medium]|nr:hypothetical protein [Trifolium medium]